MFFCCTDFARIAYAFRPRFNAACPRSPAADILTARLLARLLRRCPRRDDRAARRQSARHPTHGMGCGFYPGSHPGEHQSDTAATFEEARADFETAWKVFLETDPGPIFSVA